MKKVINLLIIIFTLTLCLTSCTCEKCNGNKIVSCGTCAGKGKETCKTCYGDGNCHECVDGMVRDIPCSNRNCDGGYVTTGLGRLECVECNGTGYEEGTCSWCDGTDNCFKCDGSGLKDNAQTCARCNGAGQINCPSCSN